MPRERKKKQIHQFKMSRADHHQSSCPKSMILSNDEKYEYAVSEFSTEAGAFAISLVISDHDIVAGDRLSIKFFITFPRKTLLSRSPTFSWLELEKESLLTTFSLWFSRSSRLTTTGSVLIGLMSSRCSVTSPALLPSSNIETWKFVVAWDALLLLQVWSPAYVTSKIEGSLSDFWICFSAKQFNGNRCVHL